MKVSINGWNNRIRCCVIVVNDRVVWSSLLVKFIIKFSKLIVKDTDASTGIGLLEQPINGTDFKITHTHTHYFISQVIQVIGRVTLGDNRGVSKRLCQRFSKSFAKKMLCDGIMNKDMNK